VIALTSKTLSRGVAYSTFGNLISPLAAIATAPLLARMLGVVGRGEIAAATAPLFLALGAITFGLPDALTYFAARGTRGMRVPIVWILSALFVAGIFGAAAIYSLSSPLASQDPEVSLLIATAALALPFALLLGGVRGIASGLQLWGLVAIERAVGSVVRLIGLYALAAVGMLTPASATACIVLSTFAGLVAYVRLPALMRGRHTSREAARGSAYIRFGFGVWGGSLAGMLLGRLDQTLLLPLAGAFALGIYAVAVNISEMILVFNSAMREVVFAQESHTQNPDRLAMAARVSTMITGVLAVIAGLLVAPVIPWLFGAEFTPAIVPTIVLLAGAVVGNPGSVAGAGLNARGRPVLKSASMALAILLSTGVLLVLAPRFGALGAAWATFVGSMLAGFGNLIWLKVFYSMPIRDFLGWRKSDVHIAFGSILGLVHPRRAP
jgi:O-antigen/teichoic acid export membrane protein